MLILMCQPLHCINNTEECGNCSIVRVLGQLLAHSEPLHICVKSEYMAQNKAKEGLASAQVLRSRAGAEFSFSFSRKNF